LQIVLLHNKHNQEPFTQNFYTMKQVKHLLFAFFLLAAVSSYTQNVGIGTTTPVSKLNIVGGSSDPSIPGLTSTGIFRIGVSAEEGIDFGKHSSSPYSAWMQAGYSGNTPTPISLQPLGGNVGIGILSPAASAQLDVSSTTQGFLPPRMNTTQRNAIASPAVGLTIYNTSNKVLESFDGTAWAPSASIAHYIGESYGGGIVFYVYDNGQHGLIAATADQGINIQWYNGTNILCNAVRNDGISTGPINTDSIIAKQGAGNYAAAICATYLGGGFGDWHLPSKYELNLLYLQKTAVGGFSSFFYWSSSEVDYVIAWGQNFGSGSQLTGSKSTMADVRAVRAF
jgi:hypothetical protein